MSEVGKLFRDLYNRDVYLANRQLLDFEQDVIDEIEATGLYPNLFTKTLQQDLYKERLRRLGITDEQFNLIVTEKLNNRQEPVGISWSSIYNIVSSMEYPEDFENVIFKMFSDDDLSAFRILDIVQKNKESYFNTIDGIYDGNYFEPLASKYKPRKIYLEILRKEYPVPRVHIITDVATWDDAEYLQQFVPAMLQHLAPTITEDAARGFILSTLAEGAIRTTPPATNTIRALAYSGFRFNSLATTTLLRTDGEEELVAELVSLGSEEPEEE